MKRREKTHALKQVAVFATVVSAIVLSPEESGPLRERALNRLNAVQIGYSKGLTLTFKNLNLNGCGYGYVDGRDGSWRSVFVVGCVLRCNGGLACWSVL